MGGLNTLERVFIALPVVARGRLRSFLLRRQPAELVRHFPQDLHITIAYLGDCDETRAEAVWTVLRESAPSACTVRLGKPAAFGRRSNTYGYRLMDADALGTWLKGHRANLLSAANAPPDLRPIMLHLTVAWSRGRRLRDLAVWRSALESPVGQTIQLRTAVLYCRNTPGGRCRYRRLACIRLPTANTEGQGMDGGANHES